MKTVADSATNHIVDAVATAPPGEDADGKGATLTAQEHRQHQGHHRHRRSSIQQVLEEIDETLHSPVMSTLAVCSSVFNMFFLVMSVFPYSGYMVLFLFSTDDEGSSPVTKETVGVYAGILSSSFMIGRAVSGFTWGQLADIYGRKFVLVISLAVCSVGSILFGYSTSFTAAVIIRFTMGTFTSSSNMCLFKLCPDYLGAICGSNFAN
jgi:sugar phosphate permease